MNDEARELLVKAALEGHKQIKGHFHEPYGAPGECGLGVLHLACHDTRDEALTCYRTDSHDQRRFRSRPSCPYNEIHQRFQMTWAETKEMWNRNDMDGWDFLTLARKVGRADE